MGKNRIKTDFLEFDFLEGNVSDRTDAKSDSDHTDNNRSLR